MAEWRRPKEPVHPEVCYGAVDKGCPLDCGLCADHRQMPCSVLLEVTQRCNLQCAVCFADAGPGETADLSLERISWLLQRSMVAAGPCNLQLSGGEPTAGRPSRDHRAGAPSGLFLHPAQHQRHPSGRGAGLCQAPCRCRPCLGVSPVRRGRRCHLSHCGEKRCWSGNSGRSGMPGRQGSVSYWCRPWSKE